MKISFFTFDVTTVSLYCHNTVQICGSASCTTQYQTDPLQYANLPDKDEVANILYDLLRHMCQSISKMPHGSLAKQPVIFLRSETCRDITAKMTSYWASEYFWLQITY